MNFISFIISSRVKFREVKFGAVILVEGLVVDDVDIDGAETADIDSIGAEDNCVVAVPGINTTGMEFADDVGVETEEIDADVVVIDDIDEGNKDMKVLE